MSKLIIANWKSQKLVNQVEPWIAAVGAPPAGVDLVVLPPLTLLSAVKAGLPAGVALGAQNVSPFPLGAYTGEVAADQLADLGVSYCLVGHSERRQYFGETSQQVADKCALLKAAHITPIVCVDEPYLASQLEVLRATGITELVLAYEPLAAIGTGQSASLEQVRQVRDQAKKYTDMPFIYGGSVTDESVAEYMLICDGALVGSASLDGAQFARLLAVAAGNQPSFS